MTPAETEPRNMLLQSLPPEVCERLHPKLRLVELPVGEVLYEAGQALLHVYFPKNAIVALENALEDGTSTEVALIGNDGIVGISSFLGGNSTQTRAVVQSRGWAYQLRAQYLKDELSRCAILMSHLLRYTQALMVQMGQTAVCNRHHSIEQQLCRWLLLSLDRLPGNELVTTQESIANMLGVRREGVTQAAGKLQRRGSIEYRRGRITVLNRTHLEHLSCECYGVVKAETNRLLSFERAARPLLAA